MDSKGELLPITSRAILNNRANQFWHSDSSFKTVPAWATVLRAVKIPPEKGATEYISLRALYQSLPEASKVQISNLWGIHDYSNSRTKIDPDLVTEEEKQALPPCAANPGLESWIPWKIPLHGGSPGKNRRGSRKHWESPDPAINGKYGKPFIHLPPSLAGP